MLARTPSRKNSAFPTISYKISDDIHFGETNINAMVRHTLRNPRVRSEEGAVDDEFWANSVKASG